MNVTIRNEYRVEAVLTAKELSEYGITYEEIDYKNIETRRVLWTVLDEIKRRYGIKMSLAGKLLIEVIKESDDRFRLCFSSLPPHGSDLKSIKQLIKTENLPIVAEFDTFEDVLSVLSGADPFIADGSVLYEKNGRYRMLFYVSAEKKAVLYGLLCEFAMVFGEPAVEKARCEEHWNCIISENAVNKLISVFSVNRQQPSCLP